MNRYSFEENRRKHESPTYNGKPKYTLAECAERLGVATMVLVGTMRGGRGGKPQPRFRTPASRAYCSKTYYDFDDVKAWWHKVQAKRQTVASE